MLATAEELEERYRVLLPPDRPRPSERRVARSGTVSDAEEDLASNPPTAPSTNGIKLKLKLPPKTPIASTSAAQSSQSQGKGRVASDTALPASRKNHRARSLSPPRESTPAESNGSPPPEPSGEGDPRAVRSDVPLKKHRKGFRRAGSSVPPAKKKSLLSAAVAHHNSTKSKAALSQGPALLFAASKNDPIARKTNRHLVAFGVSFPDELTERRDFELPEWSRPNYQSDGSEDGDPPSFETEP